MKKQFTVLIVLTIMVLASFSVSAQLNWEKSSVGTNDGTRTLTVTNDGRILVFGLNDGQYFESSDGENWVAYCIPFNVGYTEEAVQYNGKIYLAATGGLFSLSGSTWNLEITGPFYGLAKNSKYLFALGNEAYKLSANNWTELPSLEAFLPNDYAIFAAVSANDNQVIAFINDNISISGTNTLPLMSDDNGETWSIQNSFDLVVATDATMDLSGNYGLVGLPANFQGPGTLSSRGQYNFNVLSGSLSTVDYFDGNYWVGGYLGSGWPSDPGATGILMPNGELDNAIITDAPIVEISSNREMVVAIDCFGGVYAARKAATNTMSSPDQESIPWFVYPNPASDFIKIVLDREQIIQLINSSGIVIKTLYLPIGENIVNLRNIPTGMYFLKYGAQSRKFIKN